MLNETYNGEENNVNADNASREDLEKGGKVKKGGLVAVIVAVAVGVGVGVGVNKIIKIAKTESIKLISYIVQLYCRHILRHNWRHDIFK